MPKIRPYIDLQIYLKMKEAYPETRSLTATGVVCWAFDKLLAEKR